VMVMVEEEDLLRAGRDEAVRFLHVCECVCECECECAGAGAVFLGRMGFLGRAGSGLVRSMKPDITHSLTPSLTPSLTHSRWHSLVRNRE
jgi:hypothetical protein